MEDVAGNREFIIASVFKQTLAPTKLLYAWTNRGMAFYYGKDYQRRRELLRLYIHLNFFGFYFYSSLI